jgi:hypothetical protein
MDELNKQTLINEFERMMLKDGDSQSNLLKEMMRLQENRGGMKWSNLRNALEYLMTSEDSETRSQAFRIFQEYHRLEGCINTQYEWLQKLAY